MKSDKITIFYSWQSDTSGDLNQKFIRKAIEKAANNLRVKNATVIEVDEATRNVAGSPNIRNEIFRKIALCDIFIADVSIINNSFIRRIDKNRLTSNPNVLLELGYASSQIGWNKIICVVNEYFGLPEDLPFDIRQHRVSRYLLKPSTDKISCKEKLVNLFSYAIQKILNERGEESPLFLTEKLKHDRRLFEEFQIASKQIPVRERLENMANINPIFDKDYEWIRELASFCRNEEIDFFDADLKKLFDAFTFSITDFKFKIGLRLVERYHIPDDPSSGYFLRIPPDMQWRKSEDDYEDYYKKISDEIYDSGKLAFEDYGRFRRKIREKLLL